MPSLSKNILGENNIDQCKQGTSAAKRSRWQVKSLSHPFWYWVMFVLSWLLSSSPNQLPGGHNLVSGPGDPGSGEPPPKCSSKFFTFFYHSPSHNLAWCKVFITKSNFWNIYAFMILTSLDKVPKAGSSTWVENFLLLANETQASISSMVGEMTQVLQYLLPTWQDLDTRHKRMRTYYPRLNQGQLNGIVDSSLIFMVVRWDLLTIR